MINLIYAKIKDRRIVADNQREGSQFMLDNEGKRIQIKRTTYVRTEAQNSSLHLYLDMVARELNAAGISLRLVMEKMQDFQTDCTKDNLKEVMWRPVQKALTGKKSTTQLDKHSEIDQIYDHLNKFLSETFFIHVPFPHEDKVEAKIEYPINNLEPTI